MDLARTELVGQIRLLDGKIDGVRTELGGSINQVKTELDGKITGRYSRVSTDTLNRPLP